MYWTFAIAALLGGSLIYGLRQRAALRRVREDARRAEEAHAAKCADLEERLARSEERFDWYAEHTEDIVFQMSVPGGEYTYINQAALDYHQYSREEFFSNPFLVVQMLHPDYHEEFRRQWEGIVAGRGCEPAELDYRIHNKSGELRWLHHHARVVNDAQGRPMAVEGLVRDITERRQAQHALRNTEEHLRRAQEVAGIGIWRYDVKADTVQCSAKTYQITGYAEGTEIASRHMLDLTHPEDRERVDAAWAAALVGQPLDLEFRILTADRKEVRWVYNRSEAEFDENGERVVFTGVLQDITERKLLEAQLLQAQKMEAVGLLAGGVAHDFNNVLSVILGYAELASDRCGRGRDPRPEIGQILDAAERARQLVRQIAAFNRKTETRRAPMSLNREIEGIGEVWRRVLPQAVRLEFRLAENLQPVCADPNQLDQILMNLANNAVDAMQGSGCLSITTENAVLEGSACPCCGILLGGEWVRISVSDTGCGISPEKLGRIFESFYTTKAEGHGTGLGLYMVREIVTDHGGHISCRSTPGEGACFEILLPALPAQSLPAPPVKPGPAARQRGGETLLLVEDEPSLLAINTAFLESGGYCVLAARDSAEALALYGEKWREIAAVVSDLNMPGMPPAQYISKLRAVNPGLRLLTVSGFFTAAQACGGDPGPHTWFLGKPYGRDDLLRTVAVMLGGGPGAGDGGG